MPKKPIITPNFIPPTSNEPRTLVAICSGDFFKAKMHFNEIEPDLVEERDARANSNIYFICKRPKVRIVPGSMTELDIQGLPRLHAGLLEIVSEKSRKQVPFAFDALAVLKSQLKRFDPVLFPERGYSSIKFEVGEAPHSTLHAVIDVYDNSTNQLVKPLNMELELDYLSSHFKWYVPALQDLEVLYIGQAFGMKYESSSEKRLAEGHKSRQAIVAEASRREDFDVVSVYMNFKAILGQNKRGSEIHVPMPVKNVLDLVEGSLINQFQPRFNEQCKDKYPRGPAMVADIEELGVDRIHVSIDSSHDPIRLFSKTSNVSFVQNAVHEYLPDGTSNNRTNEVSEIDRDYKTGDNQLKFWTDYPELIEEIGKQLQEKVRPKNFLGKIGDRLRGMKQTLEETLETLPGRKM